MTSTSDIYCPGGLNVCVCVCVWRVRGQYAWITQAHPRAMGEKEKEGCSNNLWITSP